MLGPRGRQRGKVRPEVLPGEWDGGAEVGNVGCCLKKCFLGCWGAVCCQVFGSEGQTEG